MPTMPTVVAAAGAAHSNERHTAPVAALLSGQLRAPVFLPEDTFLLEQVSTNTAALQNILPSRASVAVGVPPEIANKYPARRQFSSDEASDACVRPLLCACASALKTAADHVPTIDS